MLDTSDDGGLEFLKKLEEFLMDKAPYTKRLVRFDPSEDTASSGAAGKLVILLETKVAGMFKVSWDFTLDEIMDPGLLGKLDQNLWIQPLFSICLHQKSTIDALCKEIQSKDQLISDLRTKLDLLQPRDNYHSPRKHGMGSINVFDQDAFLLENMEVGV